MLSYRHVLLLLPCIVYVSWDGHSRPARHLKTKFTPLNRAVRSLSTHPTANLAPAATSLPTWRGEHLNSPLRPALFLSISRRCLYRGFLTRVPGYPSRANYPKQIRHCLLRANLIRACVVYSYCDG